MYTHGLNRVEVREDVADIDDNDSENDEEEDAEIENQAREQ